MEEYKIFFKKSIEKDFKKIPKKYLVKILEKIDELKNNPKPDGSEKLTSYDLYRIRQGTYRVVYSVQDQQLIIGVIKVGHQKEIYKKLS